MRKKPEYIEHPDPELNGNPLTEAIQIIHSASEIKRLISFTPEFADNFHDLPRIYRNLNISKISDVFVPPEICVPLYDKIVELILRGYRYRNPFHKTMTRFLVELAERGELIHESDNIKKYEIIPPGLTTAPGSIFSGPSGTGKSATIRAVLGIIPQVIAHTSYKQHSSFQQDQIVWISFDAPPTASIKALCLNFMKAVDEALGIERYFKEFSKNPENINADRFIFKVQEIAANHFIGIVHFDEMQFLLNYAKDKNAPNLQILEAMFNKLGIPIFISTTDSGLPLINANEQTKRRMLSEQHFKLKPLRYNSAEFNTFIKAVFPPKIWGESDIFQNQPIFLRKFHELTAGLQAVMIRLARLYLYYSTQNRSRPFDIDVLQKVFDSQFEYMKSSLAALRIGDLSSYEQKIAKRSDGKVAWCLDDVSEEQASRQNDTPETPTDENQRTRAGKKKVKPVSEFHNPNLIGGL